MKYLKKYNESYDLLYKEIEEEEYENIEIESLSNNDELFLKELIEDLSDNIYENCNLIFAHGNAYLYKIINYGRKRKVNTILEIKKDTDEYYYCMVCGEFERKLFFKCDEKIGLKNWLIYQGKKRRNK